MGASFRDSGEILALAGCDRLTISPDLLSELKNNTEVITRHLLPETSSAVLDTVYLTEADFRYQLNHDAMATEKLAEGIRNFIKDQDKLETLIRERLAA
jgi:transaldolase